jgi:hypothetical protein
LNLKSTPIVGKKLSQYVPSVYLSKIDDLPTHVLPIIITLNRLSYFYVSDIILIYSFTIIVRKIHIDMIFLNIIYLNYLNKIKLT